MKNSIAKRSFSMLLALIMCFSMLPVSAFAAEEEEAALSSAEPAEAGEIVSTPAENDEVAHVHSYVQTEAVLPADGEDGYTVYTCECGDFYREIIPAEPVTTPTEPVIVPEGMIGEGLVGEAELRLPLRVEFSCESADLLLSVYTAESHDAAIPEADGSYLLLPGEYVYTAEAEGFLPVEGSFTVADSTLTIFVALEPETEQTEALGTVLGGPLGASPQVDILVPANFPDAALLTVLRAMYPYGLTAAEAFEITELSIDCEHGTNIDGFELFPNLERLDLYMPGLRELDLSGRTALETIAVLSSELRTLDLSGCTGLINYSVGSPLLENIDLEGCTALKNLDLTGCLLSVNLNGCTALKTLTIEDFSDWIHEMECLDLSGCPALENISIASLRAKEIILGEQKNLWTLTLRNRLPLHTLDLSGCTALESLDLDFCSLNWLDPTQVADIPHVDCEQHDSVLYGTDDGYTITVYMDRVMPSYLFGRVTFQSGDYDPVNGILTVPSGTESIHYSFALSQERSMEVDAIFENEENILTEEYFPDPYFRNSIRWLVGSEFLTLEQAASYESLFLLLDHRTRNTTGLEFFTGVHTLSIDGESGFEPPQLDTMVLPASTRLDNIMLQNFFVKNLYVKDQPYFSHLDVGFEIEVENLLIENCPNLQHVYLVMTPPENVYVSRCHALTYLSVGDSESDRLKTVTIDNCSGLNNLCIYGNENFRSLTVDRCGNLTSLELMDLPLTEFDVSPFEKLEHLSLRNCGITALDLKNNTKLRSLSCNDSGLTELDLSNNLLLETLECSGNEIAELDLRNCKQLKKLICDGNRLYRLDLSANAVLSSGSAEGQHPRMSGVTGGEFKYAYLPMYVPAGAFASFSFESDANCEYDASKGYITVPAMQATASYTYATGSSVIPYMTASAEIDATVRLRYVNAEHLKPATPEYNTVTGMIRVGDPTVPLDGRDFSGWYVDDELSEKVGELPLEDADIDLFPGFTVSTYSVFFDPNGGEGELSPVKEIEYLDEFVLPDGGFTRDGYAFESWNTMPDGSGLSYAGGSTVKNLCEEHLGEVTLYAQWTPSVYRIEFDGNGADGGSMQSSALQCFCGTDYVLPENQYGKSGCVFSCWNTAPDGSGVSYAPGETVRDLTVEPNGVITLYAIWRNTFTVVYDGNGADSGSMTSESHRTGESFALKTNAYMKEGFAFFGWALAPDASYPDYTDGQTVRFASNAAPTITLYALWKPVTLTITPPAGTEILYRDSVRVYMDEGFYGIDALGNFAKGPSDTVSYALYLTKSDALRRFDLPLVDSLGGEVLKGQFTLSTTSSKLATVKELSAGVLRVEVKAKADGACTVSAVKKSDRSFTASLAVYVMDYAPRLEQTSVTVNTYKDAYVALPLVESYGNAILSADVMEYNASTKKYDQLSERFRSEYAGGDELRIFPLCAVKNSTIKAALAVKCADGVTYELPLSIVSKATLPRITVTQPKGEAFKLMYKDSVSRVTVKALSGKVEETVLDIAVDESYNPVFTGEGFGGEAELRFAPGCEVYAPKSRAVKLSVSLEGWNYPVSAAFNLAVDKAKPAYITDPASGIIRTGLGETYTEFTLVDKATHEILTLERDALSLSKPCTFAELYVADGKVIAQLTPKTDAKTGAAVYSGGTVAADVQQENWTSPVRVSFSLTNNAVVPTVKAAGTPTLSTVFPDASSAVSLSFSQSDLRLAEVSAVLKSAPKGTDAAAAADKFSFACGAENNTVVVSLLGAVDEGVYTFTLTPVAVDRLGSCIPAAPVSLKVTVSAVLPALTLSESAVTLSKIFTAKTAEVGVSVPEGYEITALRIAPVTDSYGADKVLFDVSGSTVTVSVDPESVPAGSSYRYNVIADVSGFGGSAEISSVLKVSLDSTLPKAALDASAITLSRLFPDAAESFSVSIDTDEPFTLTDLEFAPVGTECGKLVFTPDLASGTVEVSLDENDFPRNGIYYCRVRPVITPEGAEPAALKYVTLKITVNSKAPKLLGLGTVTLNAVPALAGKEESSLALSLSDPAFSLSTDSTVPVINCSGSAAQQAEAVKIKMEYDYASHTVKASLDPTNLPKTGRYTFLYAPMIVHEATGQTVELAPVSFTVNVVKKEISATVKAAGSMDTVRRGSSGITYTLTNLNNLAGEATGNVELVGTDAAKFTLSDVSYNEDGQLQTLVRMKEDEEFSTAVTCSVKLRFEILLASGETVFAETGELRIRPVQSSFKLTVSPASRTYCQSQDRNREIRYELSFANAEGIEVENVTIGQVKFWQSALVDQAKDIRIEQSGDSAGIVVIMKDTSIFNAGAKYVLPVTVSLKGAATNAKADYKVSLTLKVIK